MKNAQIKCVAVAKKHIASGVKVEVLLPKEWWRRPMYQLLEPVTLAGRTVPAGFVSDGATVPRIFWPIFPPIGLYLKATLVHDYLLRIGSLREHADYVFKDCLKELNISPWRRNAMHTAVRLYSHWKRLSR